MTEAARRDRVRKCIHAEALPAQKYGHQPRLYALAARAALHCAFLAAVREEAGERLY